MSLDRVRVRSTGFSGGDGYTNLYFGSATSANLAAIRALFNAFISYCPSTVTFKFPASGDTIDETDGHLLGGWTASQQTDVVCTGGQSYSAPAGFALEWKINGVVDGRRPIGKSFFVPAANTAYNGTGGINSTLTTAAAAAITTFLAASAGFSLWHRPVFDRKVSPPVLTRPGGAFPIVSGACSQKVFVLRSRRD